MLDALASPVLSSFVNRLTAGVTFVYERSGSTYSLFGDAIYGSGYTGSQRQGGSVSLSADGSILAVGGILANSNKGAAWVSE